MNGLPASVLLAQMYWKQDNPAEDFAFFAIIGVIVLVALVSWLVRVLTGGGASSSAPGKIASLSRGAFRRRAEDYGFSSQEAEFLDFYARKLGATSPNAIFGSKSQLDSFIKNAFKYIEQHAETEALAEEQKNNLFAIREALGARTSSGTSIRSTRQLKTKTPLSLVTAREAHYASILVANEQRALYLEPALDAFGSPIRFPAGSKLSVYFYMGNHVGYSFQARSKGMVDIDGRRLLSVSHSEKIKPLPARRNQRIQLRMPARYYLVHVRAAKDKGKVVKTVQVERAAVAGVIVDLSGGGLSLQTISPSNAGEFLKLEFDLGSGSRVAYATVIRVSKTRSGALMHLKFVRIARKTVNEIRSLVYGYD